MGQEVVKVSLGEVKGQFVDERTWEVFANLVGHREKLQRIFK